MTFPSRDPYWSAVARCLRERSAPGARVLAPDIFWWVLPRVHRYARTFAAPGERYDWAVLHKGMLDAVARDALREATASLQPVLANEVFVVLGPAAADSAAVRESVHHRAFEVALAARLERPDVPPADAIDPVLPEDGVIAQFSALTDAELRAAMNDFWRRGGYVYGTVRDRAYYDELDRLIEAYVGAADGAEVLDLACGTGRLARLLPGARRVLGIDIATTALAQARSRHAGDARFAFAAMDASALALPDASFDHVLFVDAIEHVRHPARTIAEAARVLRPGGTAMITAANRDGLNQRMSRKLGTGEFVTNYQHLHEFNRDETRAMLDAAGLVAERWDGIFLFPYWGVPGIDEAVRHLTDDDPEIVADLLELGRRAGPEYAYAFALLARKPR